ncbi:hypothetical protein OQA88_2125 [Cercophora sp. LCS_1]
MVGVGSGCHGICEGEIEAMGLWKTCNSSQEKIVSFNGTVFDVRWEHVTQYEPFFTQDNGQTAINETFDATNNIPEEVPYLLLQITYSPLPTNGSSRFIHTHACRLYSGTSRYPIRINNDTADGSSSTTPSTITITGRSVFVPGTLQTIHQSVASIGMPPTVEGPGPVQPYRLSLPTLPYFFINPACRSFGCPMYETLAGLGSGVEDILSGHVFANGDGFNIRMDMRGALSNQVVQVLPTAGLDGTNPFTESVGWGDPTDRIMQTLDEIMFRTAVATSQTDILRNATWFYANDNGESVDAPPRNGSDAERYRLMPVQQQILMRQEQTIQVFRSDQGFLAAGATVMLICTAAVVPLFYGFWTLGREVSLSPVETAKAFGAPLLEGSEGVTGEAIAKSEAGRVRVRYGEVVSGIGTATEGVKGQGEIRLRLGRESEVTDPVGGRVYN